jgi:hypothetical protein
VRISRPSYDKPWRCPGASGGGWSTPRVQRCDGGSLAKTRAYSGRFSTFRFARCPKCGVIVLPYGVRWIDPGNLAWHIRRWLAKV